jgi:peroxiredoxin
MHRRCSFALWAKKLQGVAAAAISGLLTIAASGTAAAECTADPTVADLNFTLQDMHGKDVALSDYAGNVILLDFWATWCGPCRVEIPGFIEMLDEYEDRGFSVLGISVDDPPDALLSYAEELGMDYPLLIGDGRDDVKDAYGPLIGFPTSVIIDRDGTICHQHIGFTLKTQFVEEIEALLSDVHL